MGIQISPMISDWLLKPELFEALPDSYTQNRSFVRLIATDKNYCTIVATIIAMAHSLEMDVIAEGIETEEQLNLLMAQKCNHYQGYYSSKPVPVSEIERTLLKPIPPTNNIRVIH